MWIMSDRSLWHKPFFRFGLPVCFGVSAIYWSFRLPSAGEATTVLGVAAVIMTFEGKLSGLDKLLWVLVLIGFLSVDLRAINKEHAEYVADQTVLTGNQKTQTDRLDKFTTRLDGLVTTSGAQFSQTMSQFKATTNQLGSVQRKEETTANVAKKNLEYSTGGDEFCYLSAYPPGVSPAPPGSWPLYLGN